MIADQKAKSAGGCGCSSKAAAKPEAPATKSGCCGGASPDHDLPAMKSGCYTGHGNDHHHHDAASGAVVDPARNQQAPLDYRGETYHFCSAVCWTKFGAAPQQYLGKSKWGPARRWQSLAKVNAETRNSFATYTG